MAFNRVLAALVAPMFVLVCTAVLLRRAGSGDGAPATSAAIATPLPATLTLLLSTSNAKQAFIDKVVADFNKKEAKVGGKTIVVRAQHATSGDSWREIRDGQLKPDLWSPGDESWIRIANDGWRATKNVPLFARAEAIVQVPLCIAMWEPMAVALGYPKPLGWIDLARISSDPVGWGRYGHPEWGAFKWGHAHPDGNSGFLTVVAEAYAQTGKTAGLTVQDLKSPQLLAYMATVEQSVEHYGLSSVWIDAFMRERGPSYLSAAIQYENAIIEGNRRTANRPFKVVAIYPKEGTFFAQHPIGIPDGGWMTDERKIAAQRFIDYLLEPETQMEAMKLGLRPIARSVPTGDAFRAEWGTLPQVPAIPAFEVPGEDILKRVVDLWLGAKRPASVMMLIDTSGSMAGEPMDKAKEGAISFVERMQPRDELEIRAFNDRVLTLSAAATVASSGEAVRTRIQELFAGGGTHLYEAVRDAVVAWTDRQRLNPHWRYGIVLLTDGQDEGSPITRADLMDGLPAGENPGLLKIFTIAYGAKADKLFLRELANRTNARTFESTSSNIGLVYQELSANF